MAEDKDGGSTRRNLLAGVFMGGGLLASFGLLGLDFLAFLTPRRGKEKTRRLFAGTVDQYAIGSVQTFFDLQGNEILVKRGADGFKAFKSICPHLGCRVHWREKDKVFFCPCHGGAFDENGVATAGPPKDADQSLFEADLIVDKQGGVLYIEVPDVKSGVKA
jgi:Rieske Fe-S protein